MSRAARGLLGLGLLLSVTGQAAPPKPARPAKAEAPDPLGPRLTLPRCAPDPAAACWAQAPALARFAPGLGLEGEALTLDPPARLAWDAEGLLLRVDSSPPGHRWEWGVGLEGKSIEQTVPGAGSGAGVHRLRGPAAPVRGQTWALYLGLAGPVARGVGARTWAEAGPGRPTRPLHLLLTEAGPLGLELRVDIAPDGALAVAAPGAALRAELDRWAPPPGSKGAPPPWVVSGTGALTVPLPPEPGWVQIEARWVDDKGLVVDHQALRRWMEPARSPRVGSAEMPFPLPQRWAPASGPPLRAAGHRLCGPAALDDALALIAAEWARVTGAPLRADGRCTLRLELDPRLPAEAFVVQTEAKGATLRAGGRAAAVWAGLGLVDLVGPDGAAPAATWEDAPQIRRRVLYHSINTKATRAWNIDDHVTFLERVVSRGRYTEVHLLFNDSLVVPGFEGWAHARALRPAELGRLLTTLQVLGVEAVPAVNSPDHADWLIAQKPELMEDVNTTLLDPRHPDTLPTLQAWATALLALFPGARRLHLGHDEAAWQSDRWFEDEQNPRTAGTHRALLFAEELEAMVRFAAARNLEIDIWDDVFVPEWNGNKDGLHHALGLLAPDVRARVHLMAWSDLGDPVRRFGGPDGFPLSRVHTGYHEPKRAGLADDKAVVEGEGLALFVPAPWLGFGNPTGSRALNYHFTSVLLAGWTAWDPELSRTSIPALLQDLAGHPSLQPGLGPLSGRPATPLVSAGGAAPPPSAALTLPAQLSALGLPQAPTPVEAKLGAPLRWVLPPGAAGLRVAWAARVDHDLEQRLLAELRTAPKAADRALATLIWEGADDTEHRVPIELGLDIGVLDADPRAVSLWRTSGGLGLASPEAAASHPGAEDRRVLRAELAAPLPAGARAVRLEVDRPGVALLVLGAGALPGATP
ncbi:MAG: hypothetical protein JNM72_14820 [Deltaproteobacteria bacterium]|nr:hypothetical protein [Deltaproteobacteria bacterium]